MMKRLRKYVVELDGVTYGMSKGQLTKIESPNDLAGDKWYVTDMQESISRTMTVDVEPRYADIIAQKQMQESGEFEGPVTLIPHWKKKKGKSTTDIFFTAFPSHLTNLYTAASSEYEDNILLFPIYSVLYGVLRHIRAKGPIAVIFQHGRFADMLIGSKQKIYYANRSVAFDRKEAQLISLWETLKEDIKAVEKSNRIEVGNAHLITWIDSGDLSEWSQDPERELHLFKNEALSYNGEVHYASLFKALKRLSASESPAAPAVKSVYFAKRWAPLFNLFLLGATLVLAGGYHLYQEKNGNLEVIAGSLRRRITEVKVEAPLKLNKEKLERSVKFVKDLSYCRNASSYKSVVNHVSDAISNDMTLEVLKLDYKDDELNLKLYGSIDTSFRRAQKEYREFTKRFRQRGYLVEESRFDTEIKNSKFLIKLKKKVR